MFLHIQAPIADVQLRLLNLHQAVAMDMVAEFAAIAVQDEVVFAYLGVEAHLAIVVTRQLAVLFDTAREVQPLLLELKLLQSLFQLILCLVIQASLDEEQAVANGQPGLQLSSLIADMLQSLHQALLLPVSSHNFPPQLQIAVIVTLLESLVVVEAL